MSLRFESISEDNLEWARKLHNDPDVLCMLTDTHVVSREEQVVWFESLKNTKSKERLLVLDDNKKIGVVRIDDLDRINKSVCIGLDIHKDFRGQGYAKPIYRKLFRLFFEEMGFNRVWLLVASFNNIAYSLYKSLGFVEEGVQRKALYRFGEFHDYIMMSILVGEYNVLV